MQAADDQQVHFRFLGGKGTFNAGASSFVYAMCLVLGLPFVYLMAVHAPVKWLRAQGWTETPCVIVSSEMQEESASRPRYREHVVYEYAVAGKDYRSDRLDILPYFQIRRGREAQEARLQALYPPGGKSVCYVNPADPSESLLDRDLHARDFFYLPFALAIAGAGAYGLWRRVRTRLKSPAN